jgi:hypothetical protein
VDTYSIRPASNVHPLGPVIIGGDHQDDDRVASQPTELCTRFQLRFRFEYSLAATSSAHTVLVFTINGATFVSGIFYGSTVGIFDHCRGPWRRRRL